MQRAKKAVQVVGGASVARQIFDAGLADEPQIDIMPVILRMGLRTFESPSLARVRLEKISMQEFCARTSLKFRVKR